MPVQQHVLNWLYSVLTSEYHDVNRTYNDVAQAISRYPTLSPRTDVHTFPNGASALLLHLSGTLPVSFRGSTYRFPLSIWVPHAYPREPPVVYVTPTKTMMVRPGQHVDPQGQVYHPYLVNWAEIWDKSTLQDFLSVLSDVFAKEPPVVARQQTQPSQEPPPIQSPPPIPHLPPAMASGLASHSSPTPSGSQPPPLPPKPQVESPPQTSMPSPQGPPLPPLPSHADQVSPKRISRYDSAPPLPQTMQPPPQGAYTHSQMSQQQQQQGYMAAAMGPPISLPQYPPSDPRSLAAQAPRAPQGLPPTWNAASRQIPRQEAPPPPPDLMDEPLNLATSASIAVAPPPIPPNPEKDALLGQLAQTLAGIRIRSRQQNESSMAGLQAQRSAMLSALSAVQSEMGQLTQLSNLLTSNASILHDALRKADSVIEGSRTHPVPDIDDLLVAPTVVSNQLYALVAEERAIGDAIFMLGRAVERGRIPPAVFVKMTRSLAREWYLKKALVRKIGQGMGLAC